MTGVDAAFGFYFAVTGVAVVPQDADGLALMADIMALEGRATVPQVAARLKVMAVRASSRARATAAPVTLRHSAKPGDVMVAVERLPYARFFALEEYDVAWRQ